MPLFLSNVDTGGIMNEGNDTAYNRIFEWSPPVDGRVIKTTFNIGFAMNVSAYTSGNFAMDSVRIQGFRKPGTIPVFDCKFPVTLANITAVGSQIFILLAEMNTDYDIRDGETLLFQVSIPDITTGTGTRQEGVLGIFPYQAAVIAKPFAISGINITMIPGASTL